MPTGPPPLQDPSSALVVTVGQEHFRNGEVTLVVDGAGAIRVLQLRSGAEREWEGRLPAERVASLSEELAGLDLRTVASPGGDRDPDDTPVHLVLRSGDAAHEARLWHADRYADERLDRLLERWQALTEELTEGALPYGDPS
jgi:hypothetical protein